MNQPGFHGMSWMAWFCCSGSVGLFNCLTPCPYMQAACEKVFFWCPAWWNVECIVVLRKQTWIIWRKYYPPGSKISQHPMYVWRFTLLSFPFLCINVNICRYISYHFISYHASTQIWGCGVLFHWWVLSRLIPGWSTIPTLWYPSPQK